VFFYVLALTSSVFSCAVILCKDCSFNAFGLDCVFNLLNPLLSAINQHSRYWPQRIFKWK